MRAAALEERLDELRAEQGQLATYKQVSFVPLRWNKRLHSGCVKHPWAVRRAGPAGHPQAGARRNTSS